MSAFTSVVISPAPNHMWMVGVPVTWELLHLGSGLMVTVPAGFTTDLATVPWWARWLLNPVDPDFAKAAILHDWLLVDPSNSRLEAAAVFHDALLASRVSHFRAVPMTLAVWAWTAGIYPLLAKLGWK